MEVNHPSGDSDQKGAVMGALQLKYEEAAAVLTKAGLETDSDIQSLTREDLNELLPGVKNLRLRKNVFDTIQKSSLSTSLDNLSTDNGDPQKNNNTGQPDSKAHKGAVMRDLLKEIQIMSPDAADALKQAGFKTNSDIQSLTREDLLDLLPGVEAFKLRKDLFETIHKSSQFKSSEDLPNDNKDPLKNKSKRKLDSKAEKGAVMGDLLKEIQIMSPKAADVLKQAGFKTNSDIQSLTREDLHELLPGVEDLRMRKNVFEMIHKSGPPNMPQKELGELLNNLASSAQIHHGDIMEKICLINEKLDNVQLFINDNVDRMKTINTRQLDSKADNGHSKTAVMSPHYYKEVTVKYKMVVGGKTFGAHTQLMEQVNRSTKGDIRLLENSQDSQIIIVFCPITSRVESDVKAAMTGVPGDKPVILVKMHHVCESKSALCFNTSIDDRNDVLQVNVFYHENLGGLLKCTLNDTAVYEIQQELLKYSVHRSTETRESTSGLSPDWAKTKLPSFSWYRGRK